MAENNLSTFSKVKIVSAGDSQSAESREFSVKAKNVIYTKPDNTETTLDAELLALKEAGLSENNIDTDVLKIDEDGKLAFTERVVVLPEAGSGSSSSTSSTALLLGAAPINHSGDDGDGSEAEKYKYGLATTEKTSGSTTTPAKYGHVKIQNINNYNDINSTNIGNMETDGVVPGFQTLLTLANYINASLGTFITESAYNEKAEKDTDGVIYFVD